MSNQVNLFVGSMYIFIDQTTDQSIPLEKRLFDEKYQRFLRVRDDKELSALWAKEEGRLASFISGAQFDAKESYPLGIQINDDVYYCTIDGEWVHRHNDPL